MNPISALNLSSSDTSSIANAREQAVALEGVFLNTLVKQMFSGLDANNGFGGGQAEETWRSMQSEILADQISQNGGIGLADDIMRTLLAQQEALPSTSGTPKTKG